MTFLKSLPAILGIVGFFAYLWAGQYRVGGDLMKTVVQKLRVAPNVEISNYASLTPARIEKLISHDAAARSAVNDQDVKLIRLIVLFQYVVTILVFLVSATLVGVGIWLISRPEPLSVVPRSPVALDPSRNGPLTDLVPLKAEWDANGAVERVSVFLENVDGERRTTKKSVLADVHSVAFMPDELRNVMTTRAYRGRSRIRTVVEWSGGTSRSPPVDLQVGILVRLMIGGTLISPGKPDRAVNTLVATIDDSTEQMPRSYCFSVDFAGWNRNGPLVAPLKACNSKSEVDLPFVDDVDWSRHVGLVFNEPEGDRLISRTCIEGPRTHESC